MKNKKKLIIGSVIGVIAIVAIVIAILYFTTDLFKTNKQLFYKYLAKTQIMDKSYFQKNAEMNEKLAKNSQSSSATLDIITSVPDQNTGISNMQTLFTIKSNGLTNVPFKQTYRDFIFSSNNQNWLTLKYMRDDNLHAIGADNILIKYIAVENSNLKELFAKMGIEDVSYIPDTITNNYKEILKIDEEMLKTLSTKYGTLLYNNINEKNYYKTINKDKTETIGVVLSLNESKNLIRTILETVKDDDILLNSIVNRTQLLGYTEITVQSIQTELQNLLDKTAINEDVQDIENFIGLSIIKKDSNTIKLKIDMKCRKSDNIINVAPLNINNDNDANDIERIGLELDFSQANTLKIVFDKNDLEIIEMQMDYSFSENNLILNILIENQEEKNKESIKIQYQLSNYQNDNILQSYIINTARAEGKSYQVKLENNITLKQDVQIEKLTTENSVKLNDMTSEQISQLFTAIDNRVNYLYGISFMNNSIINHTNSLQKEY